MTAAPNDQPIPPAGSTDLAVTDGGPQGQGQTSESDREQVRRDLPNSPAARLSRPGQPGMFVTLQDISKGGCRVLRKGSMALRNGETVRMDLWSEQSDERVSLQAEVCWIRDVEEGTQAGLKFSITNPSLLRQLELYIQQVQVLPPEDRPQPVFSQPRTYASPGSVTDQAEGSSSEAPGPITQEPRPETAETEENQALSGERRRDLVVRDEIDRITEQSGLPLKILQAWLRTPELDGPGMGSRPLDPEVWAAVDKFIALMTFASLSPGDQQSFCLRYRISPDQIERWRSDVLGERPMPAALQQENREMMRRHLQDLQEIERLRQDLQLREQAAANTDKLLDLTRRLRLLWQGSSS